MNIVIIGAGNIGTHLASVFSQLNYGIMLIDSDPIKLESASRDLDVGIRVGHATDWDLLEDLLELNPDLLVALTGHDETNLVACTIAKNLGYPLTIARVRSNKYFMQSRLHFERLFCVDYLIGPEKLTANAIGNMILITESLATETYAHGAISTRTVKIPSNWRKAGILLSEKAKMEMPDQVMACLIYRESEHYEKKRSREIIFPHGNDTILPNDEVTFIGEAEGINQLYRFFGVTPKTPKSVIIVGGSLIGIDLAQILQNHGVRVLILDNDFNKCTYLSEKLPHCTVIHRDGTDYNFLKQEKVNDIDVFVACTERDEVNFLAGSLAKELTCEKVIISLSETSYSPLMERLGITQAASPRIHAVNRILSIAREKAVFSTTSMYNNQAEIMEVKVSMNSKIAGIPISQLKQELPKDFLISVIQSRGRVFLAEGNHILTPGDTALVISGPKHMNEVKKLF